MNDPAAYWRSGDARDERLNAALESMRAESWAQQWSQARLSRSRTRVEIGPTAHVGAITATGASLALLCTAPQEHDCHRDAADPWLEDAAIDRYGRACIDVQTAQTDLLAVEQAVAEAGDATSAARLHARSDKIAAELDAATAELDDAERALHGAQARSDLVVTPQNDDADGVCHVYLDMRQVPAVMETGAPAVVAESDADRSRTDGDLMGTAVRLARNALLGASAAVVVVTPAAAKSGKIVCANSEVIRWQSGASLAACPSHMAVALSVPATTVRR